jgi:hypothetical protein
MEGLGVMVEQVTILPLQKLARLLLGVQPSERRLLEPKPCQSATTWDPKV